MRDSAVQCLDYGRMLGVAGTLAAFVVNGTAEVLDTRVQTIVEVLERRFDVGRSLLTDQQVCRVGGVTMHTHWTKQSQLTFALCLCLFLSACV